MLESFLVGDGSNDTEVAVLGLLLVDKVTAKAVTVVTRLINGPGKEDFIEVDNFCAQFEVFSKTFTRLLKLLFTFFLSFKRDGLLFANNFATDSVLAVEAPADRHVGALPAAHTHSTACLGPQDRTHWQLSGTNQVSYSRFV